MIIAQKIHILVLFSAYYFLKIKVVAKEMSLPLCVLKINKMEPHSLVLSGLYKEEKIFLLNCT